MGEGEASGSADGSGGSESTSQGSQSASDTAPTGDPTDGTTGEPGSESSDPSESSTSPVDTDEPPDSDGSTGVPFECDIVEVVNAAAVGKMEPVDCGFVLLADPLPAWQAARDCVLDHYDDSQAFTLVAEQQGIDSDVHVGYAGMVGEVYAASRFLSDANGFMSGTTIWGGPCNIAPLDGCTVAQGDLCLDCIDSPDPTTVCETP